MNNVNIGSGKIGGAYLGDEDVIKMFMGTDLVYEKDNKIILVFTTTSPNETVTLGDITGSTEYMIVDGVKTAPSNTYTFSDAGQHTVEFYSSSSSITSALFDSSDASSITIGDGIGSIGDFTFSGLTNLEDVTISSTVSGCGVGAFCNPNLEHIYGGGSDDKYYVLNGVLYGAAEAGMGASAMVPYGVTTIADYTFYNNYTLESIEVPSTISTYVNSSAHVFSMDNNIIQYTSRGDLMWANDSGYYFLQYNAGNFTYAKGHSYQRPWEVACCGLTINAKMFDDWSTSGDTYEDVLGPNETYGTVKRKFTKNNCAVTINANENDIRVYKCMKYDNSRPSGNKTIGTGIYIHVDKDNNLVFYQGRTKKAVIAPNSIANVSILYGETTSSSPSSSTYYGNDIYTFTNHLTDAENPHIIFAGYTRYNSNIKEYYYLTDV